MIGTEIEIYVGGKYRFFFQFHRKVEEKDIHLLKTLAAIATSKKSNSIFRLEPIRLLVEPQINQSSSPSP